MNDRTYPSIGSSHIDQPRPEREMSFAEHDARFDATLERDDVADRIWDFIVDESAVKPEWRREFVRVIFRRHVGLAPVSRDFQEGGRITHKEFAPRVEKIVEDEEHNTVME